MSHPTCAGLYCMLKLGAGFEFSDFHTLSNAIHIFHQVAVLLAKVDDWQFDMFALEEATFSHSLSVLGFALIKRTDAFKKYRMDEGRLAR